MAEEVSIYDDEENLGVEIKYLKNFIKTKRMNLAFMWIAMVG